MKLDKFFVFELPGHGYEPAGGVGDCRGIFDTLEEAKEFGVTLNNMNDIEIWTVGNNEWVEVATLQMQWEPYGHYWKVNFE